MPAHADPVRFATGVGRLVYLGLAAVFVGLGLVGVFLPVMPTTIFLILAAWCLARSSPSLHARLLAHPWAGPSLRDWEEKRAISRRGKWMACLGMMGGYAVFFWSARPGPWLAGLVGLFFAACALYVLTRPNA